MFSSWAAAVLAGAPLAVHAQPHGPPFVVVGIGDSGTGAVKRMLQNFGLEMCNLQTCNHTCERAKAKRDGISPKRRNDDLGSQDNHYTKVAHKYILKLLRASHGYVNQPSAYRSSKWWKSAVMAEQEGSNQTLHCILEQQRNLTRDKGVPAKTNFLWGYKNPNHIYLLPVMDATFNRTQRMLAVVRDPRDICTGDNKNQPNSEGRFVATRWRYRESGPSTWSWMRRCFRFWSNLWSDMLREYGQDPRFRIVRIEDLVMPNPAEEGNSAYKIMDCVLNHAKLPLPSLKSARSFLDILHNHSESYDGNSKSPSVKSFLVSSTMSMFNLHFQEIMRLLGYRSDQYARHPPRAPSVCT